MNKQKYLPFVACVFTGIIAAVRCVLYALKYDNINFLSLARFNPISYIGIMLFCSFCIYALCRWFGKEDSFAAVASVIGCSIFAFLPYELVLLLGFFFPFDGIVAEIAFGIGVFAALAFIWRRLGFVGAFVSFFVFAMLLLVNALIISKLAVCEYLIAYALFDCKLYVLLSAVGFFAAACAFSKKYRMLFICCAVLPIVYYAFFVQRFDTYDTMLKVGEFYKEKNSERLADALMSLPAIAYVSYNASCNVFVPKDDGELCKRVGEMYFIANCDEKLIALCEKCNKNAAYALYNLCGLVFYFKGDYDRCDSYFDMAVDLNPKDSDAFVNKALVCVKRNEYKQALFFADTLAIRKFGCDTALAWFLLAEIFANMDDTVQAQTAFTIAKSKKHNYYIPNDPRRFSDTLTRRNFIEKL